MDPFGLSFKLAAWCTVLLLPVGLLLGRTLARWRSPLVPWLDALLLLPLVLPPTVIGYYLLLWLGPSSALGAWLAEHVAGGVVFAFPGLLIASLVVNLPFAVQPLSQAFAALPRELTEAARVSGLGPLATFWHIELPLVWPGLLGAAALVFAHTLGEFGVVLMIGGNIEGSTRTVSIAIYDAVQSFQTTLAGRYSLALLLLSLVCLALVRFGAGRRTGSGTGAR